MELPQGWYEHSANSLCRLAEGHPGEGWREGLCVHLTAGALEVVVLPGRHVRARDERSHSK